MHSLHHAVSSYSVVGMALGVIVVPVALLMTLFSVARALLGA
jgi:hypothetical protein